MPIFVIYLYLTLVTFLIDAARAQQHAPLHDPATAEWEAEQQLAAAQYDEYGAYEPAVHSGGGQAINPRF